MKLSDGASTFSYFLSHHLGSTSLTTFENGNVLSETRYCEASLWDKAWGEVRHSSAFTPTNYTYTGQYSNVSDFGLMFYNARWYDHYLNHFTQPDTIVPDPYNPQDWNRYSYARNNPLRYTDPSGHSVDCAVGEQYCEAGTLNVNNRALVKFLEIKYKDKKNGTTTLWDELTGEDRSILSEGNWDEGGINDNGGVSEADALHDPLTYIEAAVLGGGFIRAGFRYLVASATVNESASIVSIGSNGLYQQAGFTYFETAYYNLLKNVGLANLLNRVVILNQIAQEKPFILSLLNPARPGPGTQMEIRLLQAAQYIESSANWLGVDKIFQPSTWQWIK